MVSMISNEQDLDFGYPFSNEMADSPHSEQTQPRQRLKPWLIDQLNNETCPGCSWLDKEHGFFRLVWKHYGRPGYNEERVRFIPRSIVLVFKIIFFLLILIFAFYRTVSYLIFFLSLYNRTTQAQHCFSHHSAQSFPFGGRNCVVGQNFSGERRGLGHARVIYVHKMVTVVTVCLNK